MHIFLEKTIFKGSSNPLTASHTCSNGTTVLVLTIECFFGTIGTPTYNGVPMTLAAGYFTTYIYYLLDPPTGSAYTISIPNIDSRPTYASTSSYKANSGQSIFFNASYTVANNAQAQISDTTTQNGALLVSTTYHGQSSVTPPVGNKTSLFTDSASGTYYLAQYELQTSAGLTTHNWSGISTTQAVTAIAAFNDGPPVCPPSPKYSGDTVTLKATPKDGIGPYYVEFRKNGSLINSSRLGGLANPISNAPENTQITRVYTLDDLDISSSISSIPPGRINFSVYMEDSCPTGAMTCTSDCIINVGCYAPVCNFVVT